MPPDPIQRSIITLDFSGVTAVNIRGREWPVTPQEIAMAFYVCHHQYYPQVLADEINQWLKTPLGKMVRQWLRGPQRRGRPPGWYKLHDLNDFLNKVRELVHALPSYREVSQKAVLDWLTLDPKTYHRYLQDCHLTHEKLVRLARGR